MIQNLEYGRREDFYPGVLGEEVDIHELGEVVPLCADPPGL